MELVGAAITAAIVAGLTRSACNAADQTERGIRREVKKLGSKALATYETALASGGMKAINCALDGHETYDAGDGYIRCNVDGCNWKRKFSMRERE